MIICKSAAKQCIGIIESARDVLVTPLCTHVLTVSRATPNMPIHNHNRHRIQKPMFTSTVFLLLVFWKKGNVDYGSPEHHAIEFATEMVQLTSKR